MNGRSKRERAIHPETPGRAVPEMVLGSVLGALLAGLCDIVRAATITAAVRVTPFEMLISALDLLAFIAPAGLVLGLLLGGLLALVRSSPSLASLRTFYGTPARWIRQDPERFVQPLAWLGTLGLVFYVVVRAYSDFPTRFHRQDLAGYAFAGLVALLLVLAFVIYALLRVMLLPLGKLLGRLATFATLLGLFVPTLIIILVVLARSETLEGVDDVLFVAIPSAVLCFGGAITYVLSAARWRDTRWLQAVAGILVAVIAATYLLAAATYGTRNRVRGVVEQRSLVGARLVRFYAWHADRDRDGFTAQFGGGDCNDHDPHIYPGAPDIAGDGIDADCFAGDGSPDVVPRSPGRFGTRPLATPQPSFLIVTIDALRRDHLGTNGYARATSPNIDAFAATAVQFTGAMPSSSRSLRSIPGMWDGFYPSEIQWGPEYLWPSVMPANVSAAEILQAAGYRTAAVMATNYFQRVEGFFQGFGTVRQFEIYDPPRSRAVDEALPILTELAQTNAPFMLWVHLFNCHAPYLQDGVPSQFGDAEMDRYDTEIVYADAEFQRLLDALEQQGIRDRTVVVLASDHGEAFGEHGTYYHSSTLYEEEMLPMLFVRVPGVPAARVDGNVSLIDLAPTLVELAGAQFPQPVSGESLLPLMTGERGVDPERTLIAELLPDGLHPYDIKVLRRGEEKLMWWSRDGRIQLFDLRSDPAERIDLSDDRPTEAAQLLGELRAWSAAASLPDSRDDDVIAQHRLIGAPMMDHLIGAAYPTFEVLGLDMPRAHVRRGEQLPLDLYYHVTEETDDSLFFRVTVAGPPGVGLPEHFHCWHYPLHSRYPTNRWRAGEYLDDPCTLRIPGPDEMAMTESGRFELTLQVLDGDGAVIEALSHGDPVSVVPLGGFDVDP